MNKHHPPDRDRQLAEAQGRRLDLLVRPHLIPNFYGLLQQGVGVNSRTGISVKAFLCEELGLSPEFLDTRIQTVFLNGKAVDDLEKAVIHDGTILALSAAMPGLLGATLRRGSYYAAMRGEISYRKEAEAVSGAEGTVSVKLFNLLVAEIGPVLLARGVRIAGTDLRHFLERQPPPFWSGCVQAVLNGQETDEKALLSSKWPPGPIILQVTEAS